MRVDQQFMGAHDEERIFSEFGKLLGVALYFLAVGVLAAKFKKLLQFQCEGLLVVDLIHTYDW